MLYFIDDFGNNKSSHDLHQTSNNDKAIARKNGEKMGKNSSKIASMERSEIESQVRLE
jgi:hypothetical protein